jgi:adenylate cyclase
MKSGFTTHTKRFTFKHPYLSDVLIQITFWMFAFFFYFLLVNSFSKAMSSVSTNEIIVFGFEGIPIGIVAAIILGTTLGTIDYFVERKLNNRSFGLEILFKATLYTFAWLSIQQIIKTMIHYMGQIDPLDNELMNDAVIFFENMAYAQSIYFLFMIMVISFIKEMNKKFGPGLVLPLFLGIYRKPRTEKRIFLFIDLKSSTHYAEKLGHIKYSMMIQNCFLHLNKIIPNYFAEVYQYVGDEAVLTWQKNEGLENLNCINLFFAFQKILSGNKKHYMDEYGVLPEFKAGAHLGSITVAEVGDIKREIAYHGDTINTTARIQALCNIYNKNFLISEELQHYLISEKRYRADFVDETMLKGKSEKTKIYNVMRN